MELELKRDAYSFYDTGTRLAGGREETQEVIVPDARPDIMRIVAAYGTVMTQTRNAGENGVAVGGNVRVTVLYIPESGTGIHNINVTLPFSHSFDMRSGADAAVLSGTDLVSVDARTINPRKILVRVSLSPWAQILEHRTMEMCCGVTAPPDSGLRVLTENHSARLCVAAGAKTFTITDTLELAAGKVTSEIVRWTIAFDTGEYSVVGHRIVFKATAKLDMLCRADDGRLFTHRAELPFSQIIEPHGLDDGAEVSLGIVLSDAEVVLREDGERRSVDVTFTAEAQAVAYATHMFETVGDLYSTVMNSHLTVRPHSVTVLDGYVSRRVTVRDSIDTGAPVRDADDMDISFGPVASARGADGLLHIATEADVRVLYTGEDGTMYQARKKVAVETTLETTDGAMCSAVVTADNIAFSAAAISGVEVRFDACVTAHLTKRAVFTAVDTARIEPYGDDAPERPSAVLRLPAEGETLWQIAKRFGAAEEDIREANGLTPDERPPRGRMLLIPKRR